MTAPVSASGLLLEAGCAASVGYFISAATFTVSPTGRCGVRSRNEAKPAAMSSAAAATLPTAIPAMAPPERPDVDPPGLPMVHDDTHTAPFTVTAAEVVILAATPLLASAASELEKSTASVAAEAEATAESPLERLLSCAAVAAPGTPTAML